MKETTKNLCPCCSTKLYGSCCEPLHKEKETANSPEQLMRSRYAAFAKNEIDFLLKTTHSSLKSYTDRAALTTWAKENQWQKLEVIQTTEKKTSGTVEFKAFFQSTNKDEIHHELSEFIKENHLWYYSKGTIDPTIDTSIKRNEPCPCGSGKKYKKCCA